MPSSRKSSQSSDWTSTSCLLQWQASSLPLAPPGKEKKFYVLLKIHACLVLAFIVVYQFDQIWHSWFLFSFLCSLDVSLLFSVMKSYFQEAWWLPIFLLINWIFSSFFKKVFSTYLRPYNFIEIHLRIDFSASIFKVTQCGISIIIWCHFIYTTFIE